MLEGAMMNIELKTKRALVTASTGGIGFAVAKGLAQAGAAVVVNGRERSVNDAIARLLAEVPGAAISGVAADLSTAQGWKPCWPGSVLSTSW
jgi:NAD(P)-dependent dehydrogenase (short-subunit alcohol dehydrogenase family)